MSLALQTALKSRGFDPGPLDSRVGPATKRALRAFQRSVGLLDDGIAGPKTLAALGLIGAARIDPLAFRVFAPRAKPGTYDAIAGALRRYPPLAEASVLDDWLGQMWVESEGFSVLTENLNYSVEALKDKFGRHRISLSECERFGRAPGQRANQEAIANTVYGGEWGRINLGNTQPGDGWLFRGSGVKQITGRRNTEASGFTPEELRTDISKSVDAAARFFIGAGCIGPARAGSISEVTRRVNGGSNGLAERAQKTADARRVIR